MPDYLLLWTKTCLEQDSQYHSDPYLLNFAVN